MNELCVCHLCTLPISPGVRPLLSCVIWIVLALLYCRVGFGLVSEIIASKISSIFIKTFAYF